MKLSVRAFKSPAVGRMIHVLCDADGVPLPNQTDILVSHDGDGSTITVKFGIDGKRIEVSADPPVER